MCSWNTIMRYYYKNFHLRLVIIRRDFFVQENWWLRLFGLCLFLMISHQSNAQGTADCANLLVVCGNTSLSLNSNGVGQNDFANANNILPSCGFIENQSLWLKVPIERAGTLEFNISANNGTDDFDFAVYGPNVSCNNLGASIRCSSTNPQSAGVPADTGLRSGESDDSEGPGAQGNGFVRPISAQAGDEYIIFIDNFSRSNAGFQISWGGSARISRPAEANQPPDLQECDPDGDGLTTFNLNANIDVIRNGQSGNVTFHVTEDDAITGDRALNGNAFNNTSNPQTIYVRLTTPGSGCSSLTSFQVETNPQPVVDELTGAASVCPSVVGVPYTTSGTNIDNYTWVVEGGTIASGQGTDQITVDWGVANDNAQVKLVVSNSSGCTADTVFHDVKINKRLEPETPMGNQQVCYAERNAVRYEVPFVPGSEYQWGVENGTIVSTGTDNFVEVDWNGNAPGKVFFREFNPGIADCEGFSDTLDVTVLPELIVANQIARPLCNGDANGSIQLTVTGGVGDKTISWNNGGAGDLLENLRAGTYEYTVTDESGCAIVAELEVTEPDELLIDTIEQLPTLCFDSSDGSARATVSGGTGSYTYNWTGANFNRQTTTNVINELAIGTYNVMITDENGCTTNQNFTIGSPPELLPDLNSLINEPICPGTADGEINIAGVGGVPDYQFFWSLGTNQTGVPATGLTAGDYRLRIVDQNGCEVSIDFEVTEFVPRVSFPTAFSPNGDGVNDTFGAVVGCPLPEFVFKLYNRWGQLVFYTEDQNQVWDGTFEGKDVPEGNYSYTAFYRVNVNEKVLEESLNGMIRIFR